MAQFSEPQMGEPTGLVKQATQQITLMEFLSRMPVPVRLLDRTARFLGRPMAASIGSIKPARFRQIFTTFLLPIRILERL